MAGAFFRGRRIARLTVLAVDCSGSCRSAGEFDFIRQISLENVELQRVEDGQGRPDKVVIFARSSGSISPKTDISPRHEYYL